MPWSLPLPVWWAKEEEAPAEDRLRSLVVVVVVVVVVEAHAAQFGLPSRSKAVVRALFQCLYTEEASLFIVWGGERDLDDDQHQSFS